MSHLGYYGLADVTSLLIALGLPRKRHEVWLAGLKVRYLDAAAFRCVATEVFARGAYFFKAAHDSPVILDCGANIGMATLFFKRLYPEARVHSFEADPKTAEILRYNVEQNQLRGVRVSNLMLSDHTGTEKFYVDVKTPGSLLMSAFASRLAFGGQEISVNSARLSDYIDGPVDLLKLDVEGSEFAVMTELAASGKIRQIAKMFIEYHHRIGSESSRLSNFLRLLEDSGFEYNIQAGFDRNRHFQDILIYANRN
jgi:FkbM family methyltransferase